MTPTPKWTVGFNWQPFHADTPPGTPYPDDSWVGTGWLFFDTEEVAQEMYDSLRAEGKVPWKRPFHPGDWKHVGAAHKRPEPARVIDP